ncbi:hypothetical protein [Sphingobium yanoikuyae]|uniref:hypothetical protein n=1 Tax=Sphingobium yanoikuyae TaxID=13690 RepID=UPI0019D20C74|nr:hypothetical protein [Sphingobium yanoikuyae]
MQDNLYPLAYLMRVQLTGRRTLKFPRPLSAQIGDLEHIDFGVGVSIFGQTILQAPLLTNGEGLGKTIAPAIMRINHHHFLHEPPSF